MLRFRNLTVTPDDPVETWGVEGILTAIDRGSLTHWRRIAAALDADPYGKVALDTEQALTLAEDHGATALLRRQLERARMSDAQRLAPLVRELVERSGMARAEIASRLGTSRSRLSSWERGHVTCSAATLERLRHLAHVSHSSSTPTT